MTGDFHADTPVADPVDHGVNGRRDGVRVLIGHQAHRELHTRAGRYDRARSGPLIPAVEPVDDEYPFILTTGRVLEHWHGGTLTRHSGLDSLHPEPLVQINPLDAEMLGIKEGDPVRVKSRRGQVALRAAVGERTNPGVIFIPFHFAEAAANLLTIDALDPQAKIPEFKACAVQVSRAEQGDLADPKTR